jgi:chorismate synthase
MISMTSAGESHGKGLTVIVEGLPAGLKVAEDVINAELKRRQQGYGRGQRMQIESDKVEILSGIRNGKTTGSLVTLWIKNRDYENWQQQMATGPLETDQPVTAPRPGHADLAGIQKFGLTDIRDVLERASARETAARVAAGALLKLLLQEFGIRLISHTKAIGNLTAMDNSRSLAETENSPLRCRDASQEKAMMQLIDRAAKDGNTLGGATEIIATGVCPGLGTYTRWDQRLDSQIAAAMMSIPSVKGIFIGDQDISQKWGSEAHDEIYFNSTRGFYRQSNHAGGIEGGMSNGCDIIVTIAIKPLPSLGKPLQSVDIRTREAVAAQKERADVCVVPAAGVVAESMLALVLAQVLVEKFGGDSLNDMKRNYQNYIERL